VFYYIIGSPKRCPEFGEYPKEWAKAFFATEIAEFLEKKLKGLYELWG
jgi:hypothetical protein